MEAGQICTLLAGEMEKNALYIHLPVVPRMASTERDVLHLEEVTASVKLKMEKDADTAKREHC